MTKPPLRKECIEAEEKSGIDISLLLERLTCIKGKNLSEQEIIYLCLSLCYTNAQVAYYFYEHKIPTEKELYACRDIKRMTSNMNSEMSERVNSYVKALMSLENHQRKPVWSAVVRFLKSNGYSKDLQLRNVNSTNNPKHSLLIEGDITVEELTEILKKNGYNVNIRRVL